MGNGNYKHGAKLYRYSFTTQNKKVIAVCEELKKDKILSKTIETFLKER
jgi:hypothetical protein